MIIAYDKISKKELWKVLKDYSSFTALDNILRQKIDNLPKLPERSLFQSHAPSKVDARKLALEEYFITILKTDSLDPQTGLDFCKFLSSDIVDPLESLDSPYRKEGYLTMRTLLGWKMRYFVITETQLEYFDKPGGEMQGSITLKGAMIGRQTSKNETEGASDEQSEKGFRHAFYWPITKRRTRSAMCCVPSLMRTAIYGSRRFLKSSRNLTRRTRSLNHPPSIARGISPGTLTILLPLWEVAQVSLNLRLYYFPPR